MKKILGLIVFVAALSVSCEQQEIMHPSGKAVQFSTSVGTKTSYKGTVSEGKEAILWTDGDIFTVSCAEATFSEGKTTADYKVTAPSGTATAVTPKTAADAIYWGEEGTTHTFYAVYPAGNLSGNTLNANIQTTQRLSETSEGVFAPVLSTNGFMVAAATATPDQGDVTLEFQPVFSTLQFVVSAGTATVEVSDFKLRAESATFAGSYTVTIGTESAPAYTFPAGASLVNAKFGESGKVTLSNGNTLTFSVLVWPKDVSGLKAIFKVNGTDVEFPLKSSNGEDITFAAGKKSIIRALNILSPEAEAAGITTVIKDQDVDEYDLSVNP